MPQGSVAEVTRCPVMPCTCNIVTFFVCSVQHCAHFKVNIVFPHNICKCKKSLSLQMGNMCFNQCLEIILLHNPVEQVSASGKSRTLIHVIWVSQPFVSNPLLSGWYFLLKCYHLVVKVFIHFYRRFSEKKTKLRFV